MSLEATRWASSTSPRSKGAARALLLILAEKANAAHGHTSWYKVETLADIARCSERSIQRYLSQLEAVGDIVVRVQPGRGKRNVIGFPALSDVGKGDRTVTFYAPEKVTDSARKGDRSGAEKVTDLTGKGDRSVTPINQPEINLSTSNRETSTAQTDDDDLAAPFRADLADLAQRPLTDGERSVIDQHAATADGRARLGVALDRLRARWPEIVRRDNLAGWLASTLRNLAEEGIAAPADPKRYAHEPETVDELLLEHAIDPEPVPVYVATWQQAREELRLQLPGATYAYYVERAAAVQGDESTITLRAPTPHAKEFLRGRLQRKCELALRTVAGRPVALIIE